MKDSEQKTVIVVASARTGSSMTSGIIHNLGIDMNPTEGFGAINPKGCFEDKEFVELSYKIFEEGGITEETKNSLMEFIKERNKKDVWGFKSAIIHRNLKEILPYVRNPFLIFVTRDIKDTVYGQRYEIVNTSENKSIDQLPLSEIDNTLEDISILLSLYCDCLEKYSTTMIHFDQLQSNPIGVAERLSMFLGIKDVTADQLYNINEMVIPGYSCWRKDNE